MQKVRPATETEAGAPARRWAEAAMSFAVLAAAAALFALLFNRETTLSYSIGYNLYGAERVLDGEVPYRDFHTLYPPAIVYLNAALFKWMGISLYTALFGVLIFKTLTVWAVYHGARQLAGRGGALIAAAFALIWLRPNGPFKAVPMHYGALFLALALLALLAYLKNRRNVWLAMAGASLGAVALFKHNIGAYALAGALAVVLLDAAEFVWKWQHLRRGLRPAAWLIGGFILPLLPAGAWLMAQGALGAMLRTLILGPGEFLLSRLAGLPSPLWPLLTVSAMAALIVAAQRYALGAAAWWALLIAACAFCLLAPQSMIDAHIFYGPVLVMLAAAWAVFLSGRLNEASRAALFAALVVAAAAFMEAFPRFAREQAIAAMPFVGLLLAGLLHALAPAVRERVKGQWAASVALALLPAAFLLMGARLFFNIYFSDFAGWRANTELTIERGRGVYFPADRAAEIDRVVRRIQSRVPEGGYFFAQSYAGSSYLFLADRNNPSGAQFWGGVGVDDAERAASLRAIEERDVRLIVTSRRDLEAEKYAPMRDYIERNFHIAEQIGETIILER